MFVNRIATTPGAAVRPRARGAESAAATGFSDLLGSTGDAGSAGDTLATAAVSGLLALQEAGSRDADRRQAMQRADQLLDTLESLRLDILSGMVEEETLRSLSSVVQSTRPQVDDGPLSAVLDEIDLRAQVELAKLDQAAGRI